MSDFITSLSKVTDLRGYLLTNRRILQDGFQAILPRPLRHTEHCSIVLHRQLKSPPPFQDKSVRRLYCQDLNVFFEGRGTLMHVAPPSD
jgi:hypothetical protein